VSSRSRLLFSSLFVVALLGGAATAQSAEPYASHDVMQKVVRDGVSVEFMPSSVAPGEIRPDPMEGEDVELRFWVRGATGERLAGIKPAAWIDARAGKSDAASSTADCKQKIQSFISGTLRARPQVDLNSYFILTLNVEPVISVIDPILGFGGSRLYTDVRLSSPGFDWVLTKDQRRLFVSMPTINQVAVVDTDSWKVIQNIDVGPKPTHLSLSPDEQTLWVTGQNADAAATSVTVVDVKTLTVVASLQTGRGPHRLAFAQDGELAAVTNGAEGTVMLVDATSLRAIKALKTGPSPLAVASSPLSGVLYVGDAGDGSISVIDPAKQIISARMNAKPGLTSIRFAPDGRFGFVTVPDANLVQVIDSSNASIVATIEVPKTPDQVTFTETFAYVRSAGADHITMIRLASLGAGQKPNLVDFPGGQLPPSVAKVEAAADAIIAAPQSAAVIVVNPSDKLIYHYEEGMAAPMGNYQTYGRTPKAALVVDRSLRESGPGVFSIKTQVPAEGMYDVAFYLDSPRVVHCFNLAVRGNPALKKSAARRVSIRSLMTAPVIRVNEPVELKFKLTDPATGKGHENLTDVRILAFLAPGVWQRREIAHADGDGTYTLTSSFPKTGVYYVFVEVPSLGLRLNEQRPVILQAIGADVPKESP
jgi:YVTN family beta-propeller protein